MLLLPSPFPSLPLLPLFPIPVSLPQFLPPPLSLSLSLPLSPSLFYLSFSLHSLSPHTSPPLPIISHVRHDAVDERAHHAAHAVHGQHCSRVGGVLTHPIEVGDGRSPPVGPVVLPAVHTACRQITRAHTHRHRAGQGEWPATQRTVAFRGPVRRSAARTRHSAFGTRHSAFVTRHSALGTRQES